MFDFRHSVEKQLSHPLLPRDSEWIIKCLLTCYLSPYGSHKFITRSFKPTDRKNKRKKKQLQIKERGWGWLLHVRTLYICWNRLFSEWPLKHIILLPALVSIETLQAWKQNKPHLQSLQDTWDPGLQTASPILLSPGLCLTLMDRMVRSSPPQACQPPFVSPTSFLYWSWDTI